MTLLKAAQVVLRRMHYSLRTEEAYVRIKDVDLEHHQVTVRPLGVMSPLDP